MLAALWVVLGVVLLLNVRTDDASAIGLGLQVTGAALGGVLPLLAWSQV